MSSEGGDCGALSLMSNGSDGDVPEDGNNDCSTFSPTSSVNGSDAPGGASGAMDGDSLEPRKEVTSVASDDNTLQARSSVGDDGVAPERKSCTRGRVPGPSSGTCASSALDPTSGAIGEASEVTSGDAIEGASRATSSESDTTSDECSSLALMMSSATIGDTLRTTNGESNVSASMSSAMMPGDAFETTIDAASGSGTPDKTSGANGDEVPEVAIDVNDGSAHDAIGGSSDCGALEASSGAINGEVSVAMSCAIDGDARDATSGGHDSGTPESPSSKGSSSDAPEAGATSCASGSDAPDAASTSEYSSARTNDVGATGTIGCANDIGSSGGDAPGAASVTSDGDTP